MHLENTFKERFSRIMSFEVFALSDEKTWPDQQKGTEKHKHKHKDNDDDKYI